MGALLIRGDDQSYQEWLQNHPHGFVVNARKNPTPIYMVLHRSTCEHISHYDRSGTGGLGAFTERAYIKVCGETIEDLRAWVRANGRPDGSFSSDKCSCGPATPQAVPIPSSFVGLYPDEVGGSETFREGAIRQVTVNAYERDPIARDRCIERYGCRCSVCQLTLEEVYGEIGRDFIHVHHLRPLSDIAEEYEVDPIAELRPVCPNCHIPADLVVDQWASVGECSSHHEYLCSAAFEPHLSI